jgi:hypothetical protein
MIDIRDFRPLFQRIAPALFGVPTTESERRNSANQRNQDNREQL